MSGKGVLAIQKKIEEDKAKDYNRRKDAMVAEVEKLSAKYRIDLVPVIQANDQGIFPLIAFIDAKEKYEQEQKAKEEAAGQSKKDKPELEV